MINALIIEDEEVAYENLKQILLDIDPTIHILSWLQSVEQSIQWLESNDAPDIIFLDIQLSDDVSFKIFEQVQVTCPIIFTTAFDEYAIKAFELNSIDYLLKPISKSNVAKALTKYHSTIKTTSTPYDKLLEDLQNIGKQQNYKERFLVNKGDELVIVLTTDIAYFYKDQETFMVLKNGNRFPIKYTLEELLEFLNPAEFYRINRQFIVSIESITKISLWFKGKLKLRLHPEFDENVLVSREKATNFKVWIDK